MYSTTHQGRTTRGRAVVLASAALAILAGAVVVPPSLGPAQAALPTPPPGGTELTSFNIDGDPDGPLDWDEPYTAPGTTPQGNATTGLLPANFFPDFDAPDYPSPDFVLPVPNPAFGVIAGAPETCVGNNGAPIDNSWLNPANEGKLAQLRLQQPVISLGGGEVLGCSNVNIKTDLFAAYAAYEIVKVPTAGGFQNQFVLYGAWERDDAGGELNFYIPVSDGVDGPIDAFGQPENTTGDRIIAFNYKVTANTPQFSYQIYQWSGTEWVVDVEIPFGAGDADFDAAVGPGADGTSFGEFALNLTTSGILPEAPAGTCTTVQVADYIFTATGNSPSAVLLDYVESPGFPFTNCGELEVAKEIPFAIDPAEDFQFTAAQSDGKPVFPAAAVPATEPASSPTQLSDTLTVGTPQTFPNPDVYTVLAQPDYLITEVGPPAPWELVSLVCTAKDIFDPILDADGNPTGDFETVTTTYSQTVAGSTQFAVPPLFDVDGNGAIDQVDRDTLRTSCVITNSQNSITIEKEAGGADQDFDFSSTLGAADATTFTLNDGDPTTSSETFIVAQETTNLFGETGDVAFWDLTDLQCSASDGLGNPEQITAVTNLANGTASVVIGDGPPRNVTCVFTNTQRPQPYHIIVNPRDATNALGDVHTYTVILRTDSDDDGAIDDPVDGATIQLDWTDDLGPGTGIVRVNNVAVPGAPVDSTTCTTTLVLGESICTVAVASPSNVGTGELTASYALTGTTTSPTPVDTNVLVPVFTSGVITGYDSALDLDSIEASGTKGWAGYRVTVEPDGINLVGSDHDFVITVERIAPDGTSSTPADGVLVDYTWSGPGTTTVTPEDQCSLTDGQCTVTVGSDDATTGTLTVTSVRGNPVNNSAPTPTSSITNVPAPDSDLNATKTWLDVVATISGDATNPAGTAHQFDVTLDVIDGLDGSVDPAPDGTEVTYSVTGGTVDADASTCDDPVTGGACTIVVNRTTAGQVTVSVTGVVLPDGTVDAPVDGSYTFGTPVTAVKTYRQYRILAEPDATNLVGNPHTFTFTVQYTEGGEWADLVGSTVTFGASAPGTISSTNPCVTDADGECDVTVSSPTTGVTTVGATSITDTLPTGGDPATETFTIPVTNTTAVTSNDTATKTWIDYDITVLPEVALNAVGDPHTFTATLLVDPGTGVFGPAAGETLTITASGTGAITSIVTGTVSTPTSGTCTTNASGTCDITVNSATPGSLTITASYLANVGETSATFSASGTKRWLQLSAEVETSATNLVGNDHVFTLSGYFDDAEGTMLPADGATFNYTWSGAGTANPASSCTAAAESNTCQVTVSSAVPGTGTITITSMTVTAQGETFTNVVPVAAEGGSLVATKTWITYRVTVSPEAAVNDAGDPHVFTAVLERDSGSGFAPAAGETLAISASGTGAITAIATGSVSSPTAGTCTTSAAGSCQITVNSQTAGSLTITATYNATQGSETASYSDSGVKTWVAADLAIVKTASVTTADRGGTFNWVLSTVNNGPNVAENAVVTDTVPAPFVVTGVTGSAGWNCSRSGNTVACTKPSVAVGETGTITIAVSTPVDAPAGAVVNTGTIQATTPDPNLTNNSSSASVNIPAAIVLAPPPPQLPATGSDHVADVVRAALALMAVGFVVLLLGRRRAAAGSR
jgi:uncharacterized repeat protein (TIGR01451 family)